ncbi:hypothetical protein HDU99_008718, partial [Rhizoclosmatium hyalinum]
MTLGWNSIVAITNAIARTPREDLDALIANQNSLLLTLKQNANDSHPLQSSSTCPPLSDSLSALAKAADDLTRTCFASEFSAFVPPTSHLMTPCSSTTSLKSATTRILDTNADAGVFSTSSASATATPTDACLFTSRIDPWLHLQTPFEFTPGLDDEILSL